MYTSILMSIGRLVWLLIRLVLMIIYLKNTRTCYVRFCVRATLRKHNYVTGWVYIINKLYSSDGQ